MLVFRCLYHANRFVRECGYFVAAEFCSICGMAGPLPWGSELAAILPDGLSENWGQVRPLHSAQGTICKPAELKCAPGVQVRLAACHAARALLQADKANQSQHLRKLLPALCFNRWHESDGVRMYSQATWQMCLQDQGPHWLAKLLPQVQVSQSNAPAPRAPHEMLL